MTPSERFWNKVNKTDSCWLWEGATTPRGYGAFRVNGETVRAHRFAYTDRVGKIDKPCVLHSCGVFGCVRPDHLHLGTLKDRKRSTRGNTPEVG